MEYLSERIKQEKITIRCFRIPGEPALPRCWRITVLRATGGTKMTIPRFFSFREPTVNEAVSVLYDDIITASNYPVFEDWAQEYAYDPDSRRAYQDHKDVLRRARLVQKFLGLAYYRWLTETEDDT
jgi:hypothetical protein